MNLRTLLESTNVLALLLVAACGCNSSGDREAPDAKAGAQARDTSMQIDFTKMPSGDAPAGFTMATTGTGGEGAWRIEQDGSGNRVLAQVSTDDTNGRFPVCIQDSFSARDVKLSCRFKTISGEVDQAAGLVARYGDENNYYVVRANALEGNVRLYHFANGKRTQFAGADQDVSPGEWHELSLEARGSHFEVTFDGKSLFAADDSTHSNAGKAGVWTKADSVTWFDDLRVAELKP